LLQQTLAITASFGMACYQPGESLSQMTERADEALYPAPTEPGAPGDAGTR
jgi:PleD family two-component response regulator